MNGSEARSFLLDTGANASFLNEAWQTSLRIGVKHQHESNIGTGEASTRLGFSKNVTLSLSGVDVTAKSVAVVPLADLESIVGRPIDGILGADLFKRFVVTIDYAARNIIPEDPKLYAYHGNGKLIPLRLSVDRPFVRATVTPVGSNPIEGLFVHMDAMVAEVGYYTQHFRLPKLPGLIQKLIIPADQRRPKPLQKKGFKFGPSVARVSASIES